MQFLFRSVKRGHESSFIAEEESRPSRANEKERERREKIEREREKKERRGRKRRRKGGGEFLWRGILRAAGLESGGEGVGGASF